VGGDLPPSVAGMPGNWTSTHSKEVCQQSEEAPSSDTLAVQIGLLTVANDPAANEQFEAHVCRRRCRISL